MTPLGFLNVDKPLGITSHDVVAKIRRGLKIKKVGHAGTLDPLATGVLVVCVGAATRLSEYVMDSTKQYQARVRLGITTDTYDAEGVILSERDASKILQSDVEHILAEYTGEIDQIPPMYSAIKQGGRKLYELARAGETVERAARRVRIDHLAVSDWSPPDFTLSVTCSAGTYIRSLTYDLGESLGVGAHLVGLIRRASGNFRLEKAVALDDLLEADDWAQYVIPPRIALSDWLIVNLDADDQNEIVHGRPFSDSNAHDGALVLAYNPNNEFVAILRGDNGLWRPHKVFIENDERT